MADSVPLDELGHIPEGARRCVNAVSIKMFAALFFIFVIVVSEAYGDAVLSKFDGAMRGRAPTAWGIALQGVSLLALWGVVLYLAEQKII